MIDKRNVENVRNGSAKKLKAIKDGRERERERERERAFRDLLKDAHAPHWVNFRFHGATGSTRVRAALQ